MVRALFLSLALAFAAPALSGCASFGSAFEQVRPATPRQALAVANVTFIGAVDLASNLHARGILTNDDARRVMVTFEEVDRLLTLATNLLRAGDEAAAGRQVNAAMVALQTISDELVRRAQAAGSVPA